ncbi:MAG: ABC transporter ATP-binding protein [Candidatus Tectomicrobia bacterium]|nr:ABC transporter ATP-binding protein [Candidatus Tectomicrobia bacterium]
MANAAQIVFDNVCLTYLTPSDELEVLANLSFVVQQGEFVSFIGPSGCGKTTLLSLIAGLLTATSGKVLVDGEAQIGPSPKIGYMLQQDHLFEWRTCMENVMLGLEIQGKASRTTRANVAELLERYGLWRFRHYYPRQLSGGMRQRVALIRTLAINPEIVLLDEPFSALDYQTRLRLEDEVHAILRDAGKTVVLVTHDIGEAISMSDRVLLFTLPPSSVRLDLPIILSREGPSPLLARKAPEFNEYFDRLWQELNAGYEDH